MNPENPPDDLYDPMVLALLLRNEADGADDRSEAGFPIPTRMARWIADRLDPIKEE